MYEVKLKFNGKRIVLRSSNPTELQEAIDKAKLAGWKIISGRKVNLSSQLEDTIAFAKELSKPGKPSYLYILPKRSWHWFRYLASSTRIIDPNYRLVTTFITEVK